MKEAATQTPGVAPHDFDRLSVYRGELSVSVEYLEDWMKNDAAGGWNIHRIGVSAVAAGSGDKTLLEKTLEDQRTELTELDRSIQTAPAVKKFLDS